MILEEEEIKVLAWILFNAILLCEIWLGWVIKEIFCLFFDFVREHQQKKKGKKQKKSDLSPV